MRQSRPMSRFTRAFDVRGVLVLALMVGCLIVSCSSPAPSDDTSPRSEPAAPTFINKVWRVQTSNAVAAGHLYVFLSEGTLAIASRNSTAVLGKWTQQDGRLTMIEEGIPYPVEVLELTHDRFKIRMHNPGEPVVITFIPAARGN